MAQERHFKKYIILAFTATREHIEKHPSESKTTSQIALEAQVNRKQLQAAFKQFTGMRLQEYMQEQRMNRAGQLLRSGSMPIKEIAITCNYKSQRSFSRAFKKKFGLTPMEYKNLNSL